MPSWVFTSSLAPLTGLTFREAKRRVAAVVGAQDHPDEFGAGAAIERVIDELNRWQWEYLSVRGDDIAIVDHTTTIAGQEGFEGQYTLPTPFRAPISLRLTMTSGPDYTSKLNFIPRGDFDRMFNTSLGGLYFYTTAGFGLTNKIEIHDWPTSSGTMEVRYYRPIQKPASEESTLDVPDGPLLACLLTKAESWVALERGKSPTVTRDLMVLGEKLLSEALGGDRVHHDADYTWVPHRAWQGGTALEW